MVAMTLVLAAANGALREAVLIPAFGTATGRVVGGVMLFGPIFAVAYVPQPWLAVRETRVLVRVGLGWLALTLIFEFSFGFEQRKLLATPLAAYTFRAGNIWPVVLFITAVAPLVVTKVRG